MKLVDGSRIDLRDPVFAICERLGLSPHLVAELVLTPREAVATVYLTRNDGAKYVDAATNRPATRTETFEVKT